MSAGDPYEAGAGEPPPMGPSAQDAAAGALSEEQLRAVYEEELRRMTSTDLMLQAAVSLINLAGRRLGPPPGSDAEGAQAGAEGRDLEQVRDAIDGVRALMAVLERRLTKELGPLRDALSQLQLAYAREAKGAGAAPGEAPGGAAEQGGDPSQGGAQQAPEGDPERPSGPGPAEASGRLWVPGR